MQGRSDCVFPISSKKTRVFSGLDILFKTAILLGREKVTEAMGR
jgi:hypothetical protein